MSDGLQDLVENYAAAFRSYLSDPAEFALVRAYEVGRTALTEGFGVLEMATVHSVALSTALEHSLSHADHDRLLEASERFFVEALSPFEMAHRGFREANAVLRRLNDMLEAQSKRIAYALHDEAAQLLVPLHLGLSEIARKAPVDVAAEVGTVRGLLEKIVTPDHEIVTVIEGEGASAAETRHISEWVSEHCSGAGVEVHHGGQPLYPYLFSVE